MFQDILTFAARGAIPSEYNCIRVFRNLAAIFLILCGLACALFGVIYFAGLKSDITDKYGAAGKAISIIVTILTVPLFNLGRLVARRKSSQPKE